MNSLYQISHFNISLHVMLLEPERAYVILLIITLTIFQISVNCIRNTVSMDMAVKLKVFFQTDLQNTLILNPILNLDINLHI